jgi:hypothetical protein
MTENRQTPKPPREPAERITKFEVSDGGTLRMANYAESETRAEFYEDVTYFWSDSPQDLADAMDQCQPLAWAVDSIYSDFRNELEADLDDAQGADKTQEGRLNALKTRLGALAEEGAAGWLLGLTTREFEERVVPEIENWFGEPPNWSFEDDYLPEQGTAQGAALAFFRGMEVDDLETLGVEVIEGEHPGSTYYAAELRGDINEANRAAEAAGISVRFVAATD